MCGARHLLRFARAAHLSLSPRQAPCRPPCCVSRRCRPPKSSTLARRRLRDRHRSGRLRLQLRGNRRSLRVHRVSRKLSCWGGHEAPSTLHARRLVRTKVRCLGLGCPQKSPRAANSNSTPSSNASFSSRRGKWKCSPSRSAFATAPLSRVGDQLRVQLQLRLRLLLSLQQPQTLTILQPQKGPSLRRGIASRSSRRWR